MIFNEKFLLILSLELFLDIYLKVPSSFGAGKKQLASIYGSFKVIYSNSLISFLLSLTVSFNSSNIFSFVKNCFFKLLFFVLQTANNSWLFSFFKVKLNLVELEFLITNSTLAISRDRHWTFVELIISYAPLWVTETIAKNKNVKAYGFIFEF